MKLQTRKSLAGIGIGAVALLGAAACSSDDGDTDATTANAVTSMSAEMSGETDAPAVPAGLVGPGCAAYAEEVPTGPGSFAGMAQSPAATAVADNPLLTTLASAVSGGLNPDVNLVETLNSDEFTIFAPVDEAFAAVDPATIEALKTDSELLTQVLTYHVVPGQIAPGDIAGEQTTVQGGTVEVTGSGQDWQVNGNGVICGGVATENATVYLIDGVLMPQ